MPKCDYCKKKTHMPTLTKCCSINVCIKCISPEKHECVNYEKYISELRNKHCKNIIDNICISDKLNDRI